MIFGTQFLYGNICMSASDYTIIYNGKNFYSI